jgi:hypothetical protein
LGLTATFESKKTWEQNHIGGGPVVKIWD